MDREIIGSFIFRNEGNGNLTAIFQEHTDVTSFPEAAKRLTDVGNGSDPFEGNYSTVWIEKDTSRSASLEIKRSGDVYDLSWTGIQGAPEVTYRGRASISDGKLIGSYWSR